MATALSAGRVIRKIQNNGIDPVYFLSGDDGFLQEFFIEELGKVFLKDGGYKTFISLDDDNEQDLLGELSAFSLFEEKRIIVVRQIRKLTNKGKDEMLGYITSPNPSNCLLLISGGEVKPNKFLDALKQNTVYVDVTSPDGQKFREWAVYIANRKSIKIKPAALDLLIDLQGDSLAKIFNEVEKLSLLMGENGVIDKSLIESTAIHQRQFNIEQLQKSVGARELGTSLKIIRNLLESGSSPTLITMNLSALFQELLWKKMGAQRPKFNWLIRGSVKRLLHNYESNFSIIEVREALRELRKIDVLTKTTTLQAISLFEPFIIKFCTEIYA